MSSDHTITLSGSAAGTVRDPTPSERLLQAEVARLRAALARIEQAQALVTAHTLAGLALRGLSHNDRAQRAAEGGPLQRGVSQPVDERDG